MAVYTDIQEDELSAYLDLYDIGELRAYRGIAEGVENSNFLLHTSKGQYILTLYEKRVSIDDLPFFLQLMRMLAAKNIKCPEPVIQKNGTMIGLLAGRPAAIITFLEGVWMRKPNVKHCREVGSAMAAMHLAVRDFAQMRQNTLSVEAWRPLWEKSISQVDQLSVGIAEKIEDELAFLEANWPKGLPHGIIHADLFNDNVFFLKDKLSGIIDFYFACSDAFSYDVAICLNAWCFERDFSYNLTKAQGLLSHYNKVRPLNVQEVEAMPVLARGAAMRFFLTRLYDWFNTPQDSLVVKKDPMEYWRRILFFRGVTSPTELGFEV